MSSRSGRIKRLIAVLFFAMGTVSTVLAQIGDIHAELKVGMTYDASVEEVAEWGFWLSNGSGLLFSQLKLITSESDDLIQQIQQVLPHAVVLEKESVYTIHFDELDIPRRSYKKRTLLGNRSLYIGPALGYTGDLEFHFSTKTRITGPLIFNIGKAVGWSLADDRGFLGGFTFGAGLSLPVRKNSLSMYLNVWEKYSGIRQNRGSFSLTNLSPNVYSVTYYYNFVFASGKYALSAGYRYYFNNLKLRKIDPKDVFLLAFGINFPN